MKFNIHVILIHEVSNIKIITVNNGILKMPIWISEISFKSWNRLETTDSDSYLQMTGQTKLNNYKVKKKIYHY